MSGKFMKIKKVVIPTITMLIIASQLLGCAAASSKEMLAMLERQEAITIEVAEPISQEQGTEIQLDWTELASVTTYREFRDTFDDTLYITAHGESGKNGIVYVDLEGNHTNNSTLYFAFANQKFRDNAWNNTDNMRKLMDSVKSIYVDVESDAVARVAVLNAYFNIFADAEPNYFNGNQTLTRGEYLAGVYRAGNPVSDIVEDQEFKDSVDGADTDDTTIFANQMLDYSYLSTDDESLNASTYNGKITRAEAIYTLVKMYYNDEYEALTGKENAGFSDAKNGGDIASKQKFITTDKETGVTNYNKYWKSYELSWSLQNPDKGMPDDLYKALVVAKNHGIITGSESRWDEAITKAEAVNFLAKLYMSMPSVTNADNGASAGENLSNQSGTAENNATSEINSTGNSNSTVDVSQLYIYKDEEGNLHCAKSLIAAAKNDLAQEGISEDYVTKLLNRYYDATLTEDNTVIHHDILEGLASDLANELAEAANTDSTGGNTSNNQENTNNGGSSSNTNSSSGNSSSTGSTGNNYEYSDPSEGDSGSSANWDLGDAFDGWDTTPIGGGGQGEIPDGFKGIGTP